MFSHQRSSFDTVQLTTCDPDYVNGQDIRFGSTADAIQIVTYMLRSGLKDGMLRSLTIVATDGTSLVIRPVE